MECGSTIEQWQQAVSSLSDERFFDIMRLYLGEIKTPYNKQRLVSQLASFIRNEENLTAMIGLLDEFDIKLLTAVTLIPKATISVISDFFASEYSRAEIYTGISNLITRLFIFYQKNEYSSKEYLKINPFVWDKLEPYISVSNVLAVPELVSFSMDDVFSITPNFLAAFISYINHYDCSCKADGSLKKNDCNRLEGIFSGKNDVLQLLLNSFINLSLVREGEKYLVIDKERFEIFSQLSFDRQCALLCAAGCSRLSREGLRKEAQLLIDCICSIPDEGYTRSGIVKLAFLVGTYTENGTTAPAESRFSKLLQAAKKENVGAESENAGPLIDRMIESAILMGLLVKKGIIEGGEAVYIKGPAFTGQLDFDGNEQVKPLNVDSTFTITLMPGLSLSRLLPLTEFLTIKRNGVVTEFEINRSGVSSAFDKGWKPEEIFAQMEDLTYYELPQNMKISISDWYNSYSSAMLYQGYVLKVTDSNISLVENNPKIKKYIKEELARGIYLLNIPLTATGDIENFVSESGLDFMGKIKNPVSNSEKIPFPLLRSGKSLFMPAEGDLQKKDISFSKAGEILSELKNYLENKEVDKNQKESLQNRIHQRLILNKKHLDSTSVRIEILEADGMDYAGKIHLIEAAIKNGDILEVQMPGYTVAGANLSDQYFKIIGKALGLTKQPGEAIMRFQMEPEQNIDNIVVSRITYLRRLKF